MRSLIALVLLAIAAGLAGAHDADGLQVPVAPRHRVINICLLDSREGGNCYWASLETLANHHGIAALRGLSREHTQGATTDEVCGVLKVRGVPHAARDVPDGKDLDFLDEHVTRGKRGAVVCGWSGPKTRHAITLLHFDFRGKTRALYRVPDRTGRPRNVELDHWEGAVKTVDNCDADLGVRTWALHEFVQWWDGTAVALLPEVRTSAPGCPCPESCPCPGPCRCGKRAMPRAD